MRLIGSKEDEILTFSPEIVYIFSLKNLVRKEAFLHFKMFRITVRSPVKNGAIEIIDVSRLCLLVPSRKMLGTTADPTTLSINFRLKVGAGNIYSLPVLLG